MFSTHTTQHIALNVWIGVKQNCCKLQKSARCPNGIGIIDVSTNSWENMQKIVLNALATSALGSTCLNADTSDVYYCHSLLKYDILQKCKSSNNAFLNICNELHLYLILDLLRTAS